MFLVWIFDDLNVCNFLLFDRNRRYLELILGFYGSELNIGRRQLGLGLRRYHHKTWELIRLWNGFWRELERHGGWRILKEVTPFEGM